MLLLSVLLATNFYHVSQFGNPHAQPVVFIPGAACGAWVWNHQIAALQKTYDVVVVTLPGFDGRPMITGGNLMRRAVGALHELITSEHLTKPVIVGHSLGGTLAVMFGETYPNDAKKIIAVEGGYPAGATQAERDARVARAVAPYRGITQQHVASALRTNMLQYTITKKADVDRATTLAGRSSANGIVEWIQAGLSLDLTPGLAKISVPFTEIIPFDPVIDPYQGFKTANNKLQSYTAWVHRAPDGHVVLIQPSRHFVMIDQPERFESALETAIAG